MRLKIWQIMAGGALAVLFTGGISPVAALASINPDVMIFLFGTFVVGESLSESGVLVRASDKIFRNTENPSAIVLLLVFCAGILSALMMNDTVAIIGTPFILSLAFRTRLSPEMLLMALAFSVTTGSVMSPVGNPQNLLIAMESGIDNPFMVFAAYLALPTVISLFLAFAAIRIFFRDEFGKSCSFKVDECSIDKPQERIALLGFLTLTGLIMIRIAAGFLGSGSLFPLTTIALAAAIPVIVLSKKRVEILKKIDWQTLVFFAAMFVLMQSVWDTGIPADLAEGAPGIFSSVPLVMSLGILASQLISNVPFTALFLPMITATGAPENVMMALAAGSTLAGNLLIFGAASNIIIIQNAEKTGHTIGFLKFAAVGVPLTIVQTAVYLVFLGGF
ncbi:SLC13 family permease [Methanolacinia paynteri]|uniref:SLC13 family permease n=1 Tax=Methanolacinia paynteri TaxID=230356 RepID=UPI000AF0D75D|nr:SLC13 family permease [Methanolacinia paynteri]